MKKLTKKTKRTMKIFGEEATHKTERRSGKWSVTDAVFVGIASKFWGQTTDYRISVSEFDDAESVGQDTIVSAGRNYGLSHWDSTNVITLRVPPKLKDEAITFVWKMIREGKI